jgi:hypothetical protein
LKTSEDIFLLIKSMSKTEKSYFKKFFTKVQGEENNYLKLFDEINRQKNYNERAIKEKFSKESFGKNLTFTKNYLYNLLLESLESYHKEQSDNIKLNSLISRIDVLFNKNLLPLAVKLVEKSKRIAYLTRSYPQLLTIINWEKKLALVTLSPDKFEAGIDNIYEEEKNIFKTLSNLTEYKYLSDKLHGITAKGDIFRNKEDKIKAENIIANPLFRDEGLAISRNAKYFFYHTLSTYYFTVYDYNAAYINLKKLITIFESDDNKLVWDRYNYFITLQNLSHCAFILEKYSEVKLLLDKTGKLIEAENLLPEDYIFYIKIRSFILNLNYFKITQKFDKALKFIENNKNLLDTLQGIRDEEIKNIAYITICSLYTQSGDFEKALHWNNLIINNSNPDIRSDIYCAARIIDLIIHYELNNLDNLYYSLKSAHRYLSSRHKVYKFEDKILQSIKEIAKTGPGNELRELFSDLRNDLVEIFKDPLEYQFTSYFDIIGWLDTKLK